MKKLVIGTEWLVAFVLLWAGFSKVGSLGQFSREIDLLLRQAHLPGELSSYLTLAVPSLELTLAFLLVLRCWPRQTATIVCVIFGFFLLWQVDLAIAGFSADCGCFRLPTGLEYKLTPAMRILRGALLFGLAVFLLVRRIRDERVSATAVGPA